jgi:Family of unknown function (DUF6350)
MASLLSPRRTDRAIALEARVAQTDNRAGTRSTAESQLIGWLPVALVGGLVSSLAGWVLVAGVVVLGWLSAQPGTLAQSLQVGTKLWLLSNGVGARIGSASVTMIPWGATAVFAFLVLRSATFAAGRVHSPVHRRRAAISVVTASAYLTPVGVAAILMGNHWAASLSRFPAVVLVIGLAAAWGARRGRRAGAAPGRSDGVAGIPSAVIGAQLIMVVAGAALLASGLISHFGRLVALTGGLDTGIAGGIALLVLQLAIAPNAVIWAGSYALGPGFSLGSSSVVAPAGTQLGMLPGLPLLGALPAGGPADVSQLWWLAGGAASGAVAAWIVVRHRPAARFDETSLVGGLSGLFAGLVFVGAAWASSGDLGSLRLTELGPRLIPLLIMAPTTMGLAGMVVGFALGLVRPRRRR